MLSSDKHIRKAEEWLREVENHMPMKYADGLPLMAMAGQIRATLAVAYVLRENAGVHE